MALINCLECNKEISTHAKICPNCGCPIYQSPKPKIIIRPVGLFLGLLLVISGAYLLFKYIPQHIITSDIDFIKAISQENYILPKELDILKKIAWAILFLGVLQLIFHSARKINTLYCDHCDFQVGVNKRFFGNFCERCNAKLNKRNFIVAIIGFFVLAIICYYLFTSLFALLESRNTRNNEIYYFGENFRYYY